MKMQKDVHFIFSANAPVIRRGVITATIILNATKPIPGILVA